MYPEMTEKPRSLAVLLAALLLVLLGAQATASELVMFERDGCPWCRLWNREIGTVYDRTQEARRLPLLRINLDRQQAGFTLKEPVRYTPTFVVVDGGAEVGRITGYSNDDNFWGLLGALLGKLPPAPTPHDTSDRVMIKAASASE
jgi:Thioredoxin-like domain